MSPGSAVPWTISLADFGTLNHTGNQYFARVLIGSEGHQVVDPKATNFRTGIPAIVAGWSNHSGSTISWFENLEGSPP
jgi:hypothetical protein